MVDPLIIVTFTCTMSQNVCEDARKMETSIMFTRSKCNGRPDTRTHALTNGRNRIIEVTLPLQSVLF